MVEKQTIKIIFKHYYTEAFRRGMYPIQPFAKLEGVFDTFPRCPTPIDKNLHRLIHPCITAKNGVMLK